MGKIETFQQFLANRSTHVEFTPFLLNLLIVLALSYILRDIYRRHGTSLSNRVRFSENFMLISATTMLIISIVKASLALSLGLVGALSIVRFRAAVKEPEELAYLFLNIGLGLGMGADQRLITIAAFVVLASFLVLRGRFRRDGDLCNLHFTVFAMPGSPLTLESILRTLSGKCRQVSVLRYDASERGIEASFVVDLNAPSALESLTAEFRLADPRARLTFLDYKGLL